MTLPVPTQDTYTVGEKLTAALMNKNVRDGVNFLVNPPIAVVYQAIGQAIATSSGTFTAINMDSSAVDTYSGHSNVTNNSRYTAQVAGYYEVVAQVSWPSNATGIRGLIIQVNGASPTPLPDTQVPAVAANQYLQTVALALFLNVGDYVQASCTQNSGGSLTLNGSGGSFLAVKWVHA